MFSGLISFSLSAPLMRWPWSESDLAHFPTVGEFFPTSFLVHSGAPVTRAPHLPHPHQGNLSAKVSVLPSFLFIM